MRPKTLLLFLLTTQLVMAQYGKAWDKVRAQGGAYGAFFRFSAPVVDRPVIAGVWGRVGVGQKATCKHQQPSRNPLPVGPSSIRQDVRRVE